MLIFWENNIIKMRKGISAYIFVSIQVSLHKNIYNMRKTLKYILYNKHGTICITNEHDICSMARDIFQVYRQLFIKCFENFRFNIISSFSADYNPLVSTIEKVNVSVESKRLED